MNPHLHSVPSPGMINGWIRPSPNPLMQFISSLDLAELANANSQAEQPARPTVKKTDPDLWSK